MDADLEMQKYAALTAAIEKHVCEIGGCSNMCFALVVWCECVDDPVFSGASDKDNRRIARMLRHSAEILDRLDPDRLEVAGHA